MWIDRRTGDWHVIYHVYNTDDGKQGGPGACRNTTVSGHIFSEDGLAWCVLESMIALSLKRSEDVIALSSRRHASPTSPYSAQVALAGGRGVTVSTRERPNLFFDAAGQMTHLFNAVCANPGDDCAAGTGTGCVDCKYESWDFNLVAPLDV